jgi:eukaryotic-like serine/threonine-protein kinase
VTVANRDTVPAADWKLWFVMPGDQTMSGNGKTDLTQADQSVTVQSPTVLDPQKSKTVQITGRYRQSNAAPMVFQLNRQNCEAYVSGKPGAPSQPVERLTDGTVRLGPVPTTKNPAPGITIGPGGVAVVVPIVRTSSAPPGSGPTASDGPTKVPVTDSTGDTKPTKSFNPTPPQVDTSPPPVTTATTAPATEAPTQAVPNAGCDLAADPDCAG